MIRRFAYHPRRLGPRRLDDETRSSTLRVFNGSARPDFNLSSTISSEIIRLLSTVGTICFEKFSNAFCSSPFLVPPASPFLVLV